MDLTAYEAVQQTAIFIPLSDPGYLLVRGEEPANFLQRQTTNDLRRLSPTRSLQTILTSPTARVLDALTVIPVQADASSLAVLTLPGRHGKTTQFLRSRIFFMDHVEIENQSARFGQVTLAGPQAAKTLEQIGVLESPGEHEVVYGSFQEQAFQVVGQSWAHGSNYLLVLPQTLIQPVCEALQQAGALPCDTQTFEVLRVEAGLPGAESELTEEYTPLELKLEHTIATDKGCYTGQEVIARQMNYDKVTRNLVGLSLKTPTLSGSKIAVEGRVVGEVTSAEESPRFGAIALGVVRRPHHLPGTVVRVENGSASTEGIISGLPFED